MNVYKDLVLAKLSAPLGGWLSQGIIRQWRADIAALRHSLEDAQRSVDEIERFLNALKGPEDDRPSV